MAVNHKSLSRMTKTKPRSAPPRVKHGTGRGIRKSRRY
jgi:hypothetical protein